VGGREGVELSVWCAKSRERPRGSARFSPTCRRSRSLPACSRRRLVGRTAGLGAPSSARFRRRPATPPRPGLARVFFCCRRSPPSSTVPLPLVRPLSHRRLGRRLLDPPRPRPGSLRIRQPLEDRPARRRRERVPRRPRPGSCGQRRLQVRGDDECRGAVQPLPRAVRLGSRDGREPRSGHPAPSLREQGLHLSLIHARPPARGLAAGKVQAAPSLVDGPGQRVDPAPAQRLVDSVGCGEGRDAPLPLARVDEPDARRGGRPIVFKPRPPVKEGRGLEGRGAHQRRPVQRGRNRVGGERKMSRRRGHIYHLLACIPRPLTSRPAPLGCCSDSSHPVQRAGAPARRHTHSSIHPRDLNLAQSLVATQSTRALPCAGL
jgi:hypothetical protein